MNSKRQKESEKERKSAEKLLLFSICDLIRYFGTISTVGAEKVAMKAIDVYQKHSLKHAPRSLVCTCILTKSRQGGLNIWQFFKHVVVCSIQRENGFSK